MSLTRQDRVGRASGPPVPPAGAGRAGAGGWGGRPRRARRAAFTLVELLVVVALMAGLAVFLLGGWRENKPAALQSAQATLANMLTAARTRAMASGCRVRLLIHADTESPERFRRMLALQQEDSYESETWQPPFATVSLPASVVVLPHGANVPPGLFEIPSDWVKTDGGGATGAQLHSSSLYAARVLVAVDSTVSESWDVIQFTPNDSMSSGPGDVVLASARLLAPGAYAAGESPRRAESPDLVRGVSLSIYGVPTLINGRSGF